LKSSHSHGGVLGKPGSWGTGNWSEQANLLVFEYHLATSHFIIAFFVDFRLEHTSSTSPSCGVSTFPCNWLWGLINWFISNIGFVEVEDQQKELGQADQSDEKVAEGKHD
jgi:hypothetical protein